MRSVVPSGCCDPIYPIILHHIISQDAISTYNSSEISSEENKETQLTINASLIHHLKILEIRDELTDETFVETLLQYLDITTISSWESLLNSLLENEFFDNSLSNAAFDAAKLLKKLKSRENVDTFEVKLEDNRMKQKTEDILGMFYCSIYSIVFLIADVFSLFSIARI